MFPLKMLVAFLLWAILQCQSRSADEDFKQLFDGSTLNGWRCDSSLWSVQQGAIVGEIKPGKGLLRNSFIVWEGGLVGDFELIAEYQISEKGNSGFNYRSEIIAGQPFALRGYQADIDGADKYTGQNYEEQGRRILAFPGQQVRLPPVEGSIEAHARNNVWTAAEPTGTLGNLDSLKSRIQKEGWNELRIVAKGYRLLHYINGVLMSDVTDEDTVHRRATGKLGFQVHVGPPMRVAVRSMLLKRL